MLDLSLLRCPVCEGKLHAVGEPDRVRAVECAKRHNFARAKKGYLSLLSGPKARSGDTADMVAARRSFLDSGLYSQLAAEVARCAVEEAQSGSAPAVPADEAPAAEVPAGSPAPLTVLDAGCGTGYYCAAVLNACAEAGMAARAYAFDSAPAAAAAAAKAHPRITAFTWDVYRPLPLEDSSVDVILSVFSPRVPAEFHRVLKSGGVLITARPTQKHLAALLQSHDGTVSVDEHKESRLQRTLEPFFAEGERRLVSHPLHLSAQQARELIGMTPSARHIDPNVFTDDVTAEFSVVVSPWRRRSGGQADR